MAKYRSKKSIHLVTLIIFLSFFIFLHQTLAFTCSIYPLLQRIHTPAAAAVDAAAVVVVVVALFTIKSITQHTLSHTAPFVNHRALGKFENLLLAIQQKASVVCYTDFYS